METFAPLVTSPPRPRQIRVTSASREGAILQVRKILLPIEFHETTLHVIGVADAIARRFHSEVVLLHVIAPESYSPLDRPGNRPLSPDELLNQLFTYAEKDLHESFGLALNGLPVKCLIRQGDASTEIIAAAQNEAVDLLVMPTSGRRGFWGHLIGSVAAKVIHECDVPVLTGTQFLDISSQSWNVKHVLCGVTFSEHSRPTLQCAAKIANEVQAKLTIAHITPDVQLYGPGGTYADPGWQRELVASANDLLARVQRETGIAAETAIESGDPGKGLAKIAVQIGADLLVVGTHFGGGPLGANTYGILGESPVPVLSV
ncbi:MAG TPA: universal stress protein [Candidatus Acidoferrales bacterium]|nr:universal stress protein [Candidatus Acidoferrales bacterium]